MRDTENSFFTHPLCRHKVLVAVPHEDDEILTAGALLFTLSQAGADITIVYATNGDWKYPAETRMKEAVRSAKMLGVPEERIIFMGYGDSAAGEGREHLFYHRNEPAVTPAGRSETYGAGKYEDYACQTEGRHHAYTCQNYLADLVSILRGVHPDLIIATDFDEHPDHRMLALYLDRAVGVLRREDPSFMPEVWKRFAYSLAYTAVSDHSAVNNPETQCPQVGVTEKYGWNMVGTSVYDWDRRIRIPLPIGVQEPELKKNLLVSALSNHRSQYVVRKADRIVNSDEIYWSRRTDGISYDAEVTVSSGDGSQLNDYMLFDTDDVDTPVPALLGFWNPDRQDPEKTAVFRWRAPVDIERVILYGPMSCESEDTEVTVTFSDGYRSSVPVRPLGRPTELPVGRRGVVSCKLQITAGGEGSGLAEVEFYLQTEYRSPIAPFCKILIGDRFADGFVVDERIERLKLGFYRFGDTGDITLRVCEGRSLLAGDELILDPGDRTVVLAAENGEGTIFDRAVIRRLSDAEMAALRDVDRKNQAFLQQKRRLYKIHNMLFILRHRGVLPVVRRTFSNVIKPRLGRR